MVELIQQSKQDSLVTTPFSKMDTISIAFNTEFIKRDLAKLDRFKSDAKSKVDKENIKALTNYLNKLLKYTKDTSRYEMVWEIRDGLPFSYPMDLIKENVYGIDTCNYIEISSDEKLVELDTSELADIIAFEMMAYDLGETHESIEKILESCGIIGLEKSSLITDIFKDDPISMYNLSKTTKITDCPYLSYESNKVHDYFNTKEFKTNEYRDVVSYSCKYANTVIANTIHKNCTRASIESKIVMICGTAVTLIIKSTNEVDIRNNLLEDVSIRAFGRKFVVEPKISIF